MAENKGQTIFLSVIGIATLLVAIIGATFAFFSTTMLNGTKEVTVGTALVSDVVLTNQMTGINDILPGYVSEEFAINAQASINEDSNVTVPYTCKISHDNQKITDLQYYVEAGNGMTATHDSEWTTITNVPVAFITGELTKSNHNQTSTIKYRFHETGSDQTANQSNQDATITVECKLDGATRYYTNGIPSGTFETPASQN